MRDMEPVLYQSRLEGGRSKDSQAHLLSALAQTWPEDLGVCDLGDGAILVSTICFASPKWIFFFLRVPENGELFL